MQSSKYFQTAHKEIQEKLMAANEKIEKLRQKNKLRKGDIVNFT